VLSLVLSANSCILITLVSPNASSHSLREYKDKAIIVTNSSTIIILVFLVNIITGILLVLIHVISPSLTRTQLEIVLTVYHHAQQANTIIGTILVLMIVTLLSVKEPLVV